MRSTVRSNASVSDLRKPSAEVAAAVAAVAADQSHSASSGPIASPILAAARVAANAAACGWAAPITAPPPAALPRPPLKRADDSPAGERDRCWTGAGGGGVIMRAASALSRVIWATTGAPHAQEQAAIAGAERDQFRERGMQPAEPGSDCRVQQRAKGVVSLGHERRAEMIAQYAADLALHPASGGVQGAVHLPELIAEFLPDHGARVILVLACIRRQLVLEIRGPPRAELAAYPVVQPPPDLGKALLDLGYRLPGLSALSVQPAQVLQLARDLVPQVLRLPGEILLLGRDVSLPLSDAGTQPAHDRGGGLGRRARGPGD